MRYLIALTFILSAPLSMAQPKQKLEAPEPPKLADVIKANASSSSHTAEKEKKADAERGIAKTDSASPPDPDIRIVRKADAVMEEYRFNGQLYMVKVVPKVGKPYYLYDHEGNGTMIKQDESPSHIEPPRWTLFSW